MYRPYRFVPLDIEEPVADTDTPEVSVKRNWRERPVVAVASWLVFIIGLVFGLPYLSIGVIIFLVATKSFKIVVGRQSYAEMRDLERRTKEGARRHRANPRARRW